MIDIASGEVEDRGVDTQNPAAVELGRLGGKMAEQREPPSPAPRSARELPGSRPERWAAKAEKK
jgi:hypothetical protein